MGKCMLYTNLVLSLLGVIFGISGFVVFFCVYHNFVAGTWTALSGIFAAICLQLHYLYWKNNLENYYTAQALLHLSDLGISVFFFSTGFFSWYLFSTAYWHIPMMPIEGSSTISAVWAFMTAKWGLNLFLASRHYGRLLLFSYSPLSTNA